MLYKSQIAYDLCDEFDKEFNSLAVFMYNLQILIEHCHRNTKSEPRHESLDDAYKAFAERKDRFIEMVIGDTGRGYGVIDAIEVPEYSVEMPATSAELILKLSLEIIRFAQKYNIPSAESLGQELYETGATLKYKLAMNNPNEG